ncbi:MAG: UPF0280 family protein [Anaerosomatales bacterium]|nr:UPF0280 family protein [Anaerosomatales bacterium]
MAYEPRTYRHTVSASGLQTFQVVRRETDLQISAVRDLTSEAVELVDALRADLERYIGRVPRFAESYAPLDVEPGASEIVRAMAAAAQAAGVGPMAAVAGAIAERVARGLAEKSPDVIVENGGDLYMMGAHPRTVALWAGTSPLSGRVGIAFDADRMPIAVCTSSGTIGHSQSFGRADTVTVIARDGALADAVATALANRVRDAGDVSAILRHAEGIEGVSGVVVILGDHLGAWGDVRLTRVEEDTIRPGTPSAERGNRGQHR